MVGPFPGVSYSFGALRQTYGPLFVRCDVCRRYARLYMAAIRDTDYRTKTFSCCRCGTDGALAITEHGDRDDGLPARPGRRATASPCYRRAVHWAACARPSPVREALRGEGPYTMTVRLSFFYSRQGLRLPLRKGLPPL
jgi:hypothetical protein